MYLLRLIFGGVYAHLVFTRMKCGILILFYFYSFYAYYIFYIKFM